MKGFRLKVLKVFAALMMGQSALSVAGQELRFTAPAGTVTTYRQATTYEVEPLPFEWPESLEPPIVDGGTGSYTEQSVATFTERVLADGSVEWVTRPQLVDGCLERGVLRYRYEGSRVVLDATFLETLTDKLARRFAACGQVKSQADLQQQVDALLTARGFADRSTPQPVREFMLPLVVGRQRTDSVADFLSMGVSVTLTTTYLGTREGRHHFHISARVPLQRFGLEELEGTKPGDSGWTTTGPVTYSDTVAYLPDGRLARDVMRIVTPYAYFVQPGDGSRAVFSATRDTWTNIIEVVEP